MSIVLIGLMYCVCIRRFGIEKYGFLCVSSVVRFLRCVFCCVFIFVSIVRLNFMCVMCVIVFFVGLLVCVIMFLFILIVIFFFVVFVIIRLSKSFRWLSIYVGIILIKLI